MGPKFSIFSKLQLVAFLVGVQFPFEMKLALEKELFFILSALSTSIRLPNLSFQYASSPNITFPENIRWQ